MRRRHGPFRRSDAFCPNQFSVGYTIDIYGSDLRQGQVVCWASALFLGNGLVAASNAVTVVAHLAGATAVGSAIFLILELSQPYTGVVRLSSAGVDRLLQVLAEVDAKGAAQTEGL